MSFDPRLPVETRDGRAARIVCTDCKGRRPILALVTSKEGEEYVGFYTAQGEAKPGAGLGTDLVNVKRLRIGWLNVYQSGDQILGGAIWPTWKAANGNLSTEEGEPDFQRIACIELRFNDGDGLAKQEGENVEQGNADRESRT